MRCFFCPKISEPANFAEISEMEQRHLFASLRREDGDIVNLIDGSGTLAIARIEGKRLKIVSKSIVPCKLPLLHLFFCPPHNKNKMDIILTQSAELGVYSLTPMIAENSVSKPESVPERWNLHLIEGAKQSCNPFLPVLNPVLDLKSAIRKVQNEKILSFFGALRKTSVRSVPIESANLAWFVGPEGGFTGSEEDMMSEAGFFPMKIGERVLRIETACAVGCAILIDRLSITMHRIF